MVIINLTKPGNIYTSNTYLVRGTWNTIEDINTLVDVGRDPRVVKLVKKIRTGAGQKKLAQVVLTHSHYDHTSNLPLIQDSFHPVVYAYSPSLEGVNHLLRDGETLRLGDRIFEVIHTPGHSTDSICLYCEEESILFAGDTQFLIRTVGGSYEDGFVRAFERLCQKDIRTIYFGHGEPLIENCNARLRRSLMNVKQSRLAKNALKSTLAEF